MRKKMDLSKPKPIIPPFNGPAHYMRMATIKAAEEILPDQKLVIDLAGKRYELKLPGVISLTALDGVPPVDPPDPVEPSKVVSFGTNTFPWVPLDKVAMFSTLRCYIASGWIWRPNGLFSQPMFQAETEVAHGLDEYFERARDAGIDILPCINQTPD